MDSCYLASEAKQDIAQIRVWTDKLVRYLVHTHWHNDHTMGNATYAAAFPDVSIVAHSETRTMMNGYLSGWYARHTAQIAFLKNQLATGKGERGMALTDAQLSAA